jgi:mannose-6-phosphate isomerase-like protein (cupin superfamily)
MHNVDFFGRLIILRGEAANSTLLDGRGAIFTWVPKEDIKEFNLVIFEPGKVRGNHFHPEFTEFFMVVEGQVAVFTEEKVTRKSINTLAGPGFVFKAEPFAPHAIRSITAAKCISMITKPWAECETPIVYEPLTPYDTDYLKYRDSN